MIEKVRQMLAQDRRLSLRLIAEALGISILGKQKICFCLVPHEFTDEQNTKRMETLLIAFFVNIIYKEFVPAGQTFNAAFYQSVLK
ncbi:hypothetical protein QE152_g34508 [Popillia japonica]|uniref:Uncharacterized protein n=1 Tax=Popillia japonica TaxID=7064 RepID=A0AAW1ISU3_POPJA